MNAHAPATPPTDDKDWTYVITNGCPDCGFDPTHDVTTTAARLRATIPVWRDILARPDATRRPSEQVWSPLEYGCHVRDVCRRFDERLSLMLTQDNPTFPNWDQDQTAIQDRYWEQDPHIVADEYEAAAEQFAGVLSSVTPEQLSRTGQRSDGSRFTVQTLQVYFLHDIVHHEWDVTAG